MAARSGNLPMMISHQDQSDLIRLRDEGVRFALAFETMFGKRCNLTGHIGDIDAAIYLGMTDAEFKASQVGIVNRRGYDIEYKNVLY